ncbi:MAG: hypothetical protein IJE02_04790 [Clostridia bacterium]|nr:hypothetical protein [Clostridia bacterium]
MSFYQKSTTWKVVYYPKELNAGQMGVALIEAPDHHAAMYTFQQQYAGEYTTVYSCKKLFED